MNAWLPSFSSSQQKVYVPFVKEIEKASNGRVKITIYEGGVIGKERESLESAEGGLADLSYTDPAQLYPGRFPLSSLLALPMLNIPSTTIQGKILWDLYEKFPEVQAEYSGIKLLSCTGTVVSHVCSTDPVYRLEDLKGKKIAATGHLPKFFKAAGAIPVSLTRSDIYMSMERGIIDAFHTGVVGVASWRVYDVMNYMTRSYLQSGLWIFFINEDSWNELPPDVQDAIWSKTGGPKGVEFLGGRLDSIVVELTQRVLDEDIEIIDLTPEEMARWQELGKPIWDAEIARLEARGLPAQAVFDEILLLVKKYSE